MPLVQLDLPIVYEAGEDGGVIASIPAVPDVLRKGRTRKEARENVLDALALFLSPETQESRDHDLIRLSIG